MQINLPNPACNSNIGFFIAWQQFLSYLVLSGGRWIFRNLRPLSIIRKGIVRSSGTMTRVPVVPAWSPTNSARVDNETGSAEPMQFSVIIPTLNEEKNIRWSIESAAAGAEGEIIVVDGGSTDGTVKSASALGATVFSCEASRGRQMNLGAEKAVGEILLFLHADTTLPEGWPQFLRREFVRPALEAGLFRSRFDDRNVLLRFCSFLTRYETRLTSFGDQCIVVRRSFFRQLGGFPEWPLFEDLRFLELARRRTKVRKFPLEGVTSARRFVRNGPVIQQMKNIGLVARYFIGGSPFLLARKYNGGEGEMESSRERGTDSQDISLGSSDGLSTRERS